MRLVEILGFSHNFSSCGHQLVFKLVVNGFEYLLKIHSCKDFEIDEIDFLNVTYRIEG